MNDESPHGRPLTAEQLITILIVVATVVVCVLVVFHQIHASQQAQQRVDQTVRCLEHAC